MIKYSNILLYLVSAQIGAIIMTMISEFLYPPKAHDLTVMIEIGIAALFFTGFCICKTIEQLTEKTNADSYLVDYRRNSVLGMD